MLDPKELLQEALKLPPEARARLAGSLLDSLDEDDDATADAQWDQEIRQRLADIDQGRVRLVSWTDARKSITR